MFLMTLIGVMIVLLNATVIGVFVQNQKLRNSQYYYKLSFAVADTLVGAIIFPTMISNQANVLSKPFDHVLRTPAPTVSNISGTSNKTIFYNKDSAEDINQHYINLVGFFTTLSLFVSVYTLMIASFDRFMAVFRPLQYNKLIAIKRAKLSCISLWLFAIVVSTVPMFIEDLQYGMISSILVTSAGQYGIILLIIAFVLPLVIVWAVTVSTFIVSLQHAKRRNKLTSQNTAKVSIEVRLAKTLGIMVGVFSACVIPTLAILIVPMFTPGLRFNHPCELNLKAALIFTSIEYCVIFLLMSNSLWNYFIYSARNKGFRTAASGLYKPLFSKIKCNAIRNATRDIISDVRRISQVSLNNIRRPSSDSGQRKKSVLSAITDGTKLDSKEATKSEETTSSTGKKSMPSSGLTKQTVSSHHSTNDHVTVTVHSKSFDPKKIKTEDIELSTFSSFVIDARTDHLFESVMEKVDEYH